ncbi:TPA: acetyl-CoA hydrolase/transferase family protein [Streptococcus suis]
MFSRLFEEKLISSENAADLVQNGDWIDYGISQFGSRVFDKALAERIHELRDVKIRGFVLFSDLEVLKKDITGEHVTYYSWYFSGFDRSASNQKNVYFVPVSFSELPKQYEDMKEDVDIAVFQVSKMDNDGYFRLGGGTAHLYRVIQRAKTVIVEVNSALPILHGKEESKIHISQVDHIIDGELSDVIYASEIEPTELDLEIGKHILPHIKNGSCLQIGIGGLPAAVSQLIADSDLHDLGIHTEVFVEGMVTLAEKGKITGAHKQIDKNKMVTATIIGTEKMYQFLDNNPDFCMAPVDYVNDVRTISKLENFISINSAIEIDLYGQVNAETVGHRQISGTGGQMNFVHGAYLSKGGKSFICLTSTFTDKSGKLHSRIRPTLPQGTIVTTPRTFVNYIVTEYGCVNLKGLSTWERAAALISIAHPDFREELKAEAEKMGIWKHDFI